MKGMSCTDIQLNELVEPPFRDVPPVFLSVNISLSDCNLLFIYLFIYLFIFLFFSDIHLFFTSGSLRPSQIQPHGT